ncbi:hypothetical protein R1flu_017160 [Riccia fluitans]|uniref:Uncharacterized protein n=1 Tax=Riccia fluitans TaxID=41844 RepID=A0ABD1XE41_9MARC
MSTPCAPLCAVSGSSKYRQCAVTGFCSTTIPFCISQRKWCSTSGCLLYKPVLWTCGGKSKGSRISFDLSFFPRRNCDAFIHKSAEGTENSVNDEQILGSNDVRNFSREENRRYPQTKAGETGGWIDEAAGTTTSLDSESDDYSTLQGENSVSLARSRETGSRESVAGGEVGHDYSSEPSLGKNEDAEYVTKIMVPRQRVIRIPKAELVDALSFSSQSQVKLSSISAVLELILHAKHKFLLEELRSDYAVRQSTKEDSSGLLKANTATSANISERISRSRNPSSEDSSLCVDEERQHEFDPPAEAADVHSATEVDNIQNKLPEWKAWVMSFLGAFRGAEFASSNEADSRNEETDDDEARTTSTKRFQRNFLKLLKNAQFDGLSVDDLELTAALNSDYLLTLPISVDWKRASNSNIVIYRRGYAKEQQKGFLVGAKFDYLQSALLKVALKGLSRPLISTGHWLIQIWRFLRNDPEGKALAESVERWVEEPLQPAGRNTSQDTSDENAKELDMLSMESEMDLPIWEAAQQAVPRYEAVLSSAGSRGLLLRRILVRMGILPSESIPATLSGDLEDSEAVEPHLRPSFISRVSMKDIWYPASRAVVGENPWKRFRAALSVFFTRVTLQEPAFQELVLLYCDAEGEQSEASSLRLQMYKTIPLPELKIVFPSKKLSFRLIDTLRLDLTTFVGLAAFLWNYHFEDFLNSPSAFALDVIAASALSVVVGRAALGYKQTSDRYQLLVNKTLYEKTLGNGFGVVHFLIDASEEQQASSSFVMSRDCSFLKGTSLSLGVQIK